MNGGEKYSGVWPVMLTPFDKDREIDWPSLKKLIDWYIAAGVHGLFANCQSSEMFFLTQSESLKLTRFVLDHVAGRVPVVASGHTASAISEQIDQLGAMAETGVDSVIMISNRFAMQSESDDVVLKNLKKITAALPEKVGLGIYECPYPYKRLLSDETVAWCAQSDRFTFIKDTCCDLATIKRRVELSAGSRLHLANANSQTLLASFEAGCKAFSGVMANFHPELYVWLYENWQSEPEKAQRLSDYLSTAALVENLDYPICGKYFQQSLGNFRTILCRVRDSQGFNNTFYPGAIDAMARLGDEIRKSLSL